MHFVKSPMGKSDRCFCSKTTCVVVVIPGSKLGRILGSRLHHQKRVSTNQWHQYNYLLPPIYNLHPYNYQLPPLANFTFMTTTMPGCRNLILIRSTSQNYYHQCIHQVDHRQPSVRGVESNNGRQSSEVATASIVIPHYHPHHNRCHHYQSPFATSKGKP